MADRNRNRGGGGFSKALGPRDPRSKWSTKITKIKRHTGMERGSFSLALMIVMALSIAAVGSARAEAPGDKNGPEKDGGRPSK